MGSRDRRAEEGGGMIKQYTIYDMDIETDRRPCRYRFHRYVGQKVKMRNFGVCIITEIPGAYYTYIKDKKGQQLVGTPTTIWPAEEEEDEG